MIIDAVGTATNEIAADRNTKQIKDGGAIFEGKPGVRATLTSDTASVDSLVARAMQAPAIRQSQVDALRLSIRDGNYKVDPGEIADSMLKEQG